MYVSRKAYFGNEAECKVTLSIYGCMLAALERGIGEYVRNICLSVDFTRRSVRRWKVNVVFLFP